MPGITMLEEVVSEKLDYFGDIHVSLEYDQNGAHNGFQYRIFDSETLWSNAEMHRQKSTPEMNQILKISDYRLIDKTTDETRFDPSWSYRLYAPEWPIFREWVWAYYSNRLNHITTAMQRYPKQRLMSGEHERVMVYKVILTMLQLDTQRTAERLYEWVRTENQKERVESERFITYTYKSFVTLLEEYRSLLEHEKSKRESAHGNN